MQRVHSGTCTDKKKKIERNKNKNKKGEKKESKQTDETSDVRTTLVVTIT